MKTLARRIVAVTALLAGILGMLLGFELWLYPKNMVLHYSELALPFIVGGLFAWWLGCRLATATPAVSREVRHDQADWLDAAGQDNVLDLPAAVRRR